MPLSDGTDATRREALRRFWAVVEAERDRLEAHVLEAARSIPPFARALEQMDPSIRMAERAQSRARERAALVDGQWDAYLTHLREQGVSYARMGIGLRDWYRLLSPYREVVQQAVVPEASDHARDVLLAMGLFLDTAMATIGSAYIEEKETLERAAEERLALYIDVFRNAPAGMLMYRWEAPPDLASFRLIAANPAASDLAGPQLVGNLGKTLGETSSPVLQTEIPGLFARAIEKGEPQSWSRSAGGDAETRDYDGRCFSLGRGYLGVVFEDVTERRRMERSIERYVRELERSNRELDDFAYVASHDLKAPLRDIENLARWIAEDAGERLPEPAARHLSLLSERARRLERLLDDLLQYSRAGRIAPNPEPVALRRVVDDAVTLAAVPEDFQVVVLGPDVQLHVPVAPLSQVLRNLLSNAAKHHDRRQGRIEVLLVDQGDQVRIAVKDDGPGIPAEFHDRVFRMFQTLRPRDEVEGSGMGLAIVKKAVEAHGGTIEIESAGRGTTIVFTWPKTWVRPAPVTGDAR